MPLTATMMCQPAATPTDALPTKTLAATLAHPAVRLAAFRRESEQATHAMRNARAHT